MSGLEKIGGYLHPMQLIKMRKPHMNSSKALIKILATTGFNNAFSATPIPLQIQYHRH